MSTKRCHEQLGCCELVSISQIVRSMECTPEATPMFNSPVHALILHDTGAASNSFAGRDRSISFDTWYLIFDFVFVEKC